ncbi:MAG TPA: ATP-dependent Clp protease ATP-binding subunit [Rhodospirillaceae bacterium]|nr:MAG: hypothetical protein A2018_02290 [Alphaproteobacteria bacterium GWF2_58_20]HAU29523.1 ATP-dependent Clp protease ATP-binding subunit [Rhodospirillaceae bacterium]
MNEPSKTSHRDWVVPDDIFENLVFNYTRDITHQAREGRFDPIVGREKEIQDIILILLQRGRKNVAVLGSAGVGKTAIFVKLAQVINEGKVPEYLKNARVIELEMSSLAAGTLSRSEFEGRLLPIIKGAAERNATKELPPIIFAIDEMHTIMRSSDASSASGVADILKPYLTAGDLHVLGATTKDEFRDFVAKDPALDRRFQKIHLEQPSSAESLKILHGIRPFYEKHFDITVSDECLEKIVEWTTKFMPRRTHPDKDIITLDVSCARQILFVGKGTALDLNYIRETIAVEIGLIAAAID